MIEEAVTVEMSPPLGPPNPMNLPAVLPSNNGETGIEPYRGASSQAVTPEAQTILIAPLSDEDVEIRPDGLVYLPEIKYRRKLIQAFGAGGWAMIPRSGYGLQDETLTREYALFAGGRFLSEARGEQDYLPNNPNMSYATAAEGVKSNALMRCCKDLGIASELWDPAFIEPWKARCAIQVWRKGQNKPAWRRKDRQPFYDETGPVTPSRRPAAQPEQKPTSSPADDAARGGRVARPPEPANAPPGPSTPPAPPALTTDEWLDKITYLGEDPDRNDTLKDVLEAQRFRSCAVVPKDKRRGVLLAVQAACATAKVPCQPLIQE